MRIQVGLVVVIALAAFIGTTRGDDEDVATPVSDCSITDAKETEIPHKILEMVLDCLSVKSFEEIDENWTADAQREFLKDYCATTSPRIHECLANVTRASHACQNPTNHDIYQMLRELLETTLTTLCVDNGELFSRLYIPHANFTKHFLECEHTRDCLHAATFRVNMLVASEIDASIRLYMLYQEAQNAKQCVSDGKEGDPLYKNSVDRFLTEILAKSKCIHPEEKTIVLCSSIDAHSIITPSVCPIEAQDGDVRNDMLIARLGGCFDRNTARFQEMGDLKELSDFRSLFENYCQNQLRISLECMAGMTVFSSLCQNETQHESFELLVEALKHALVHGCFEHGKHIARLVHNVMSEENATTTSNVLTRCFDLSKSTRQTSDLPDGFDNALRFYRQAKVFKKCVMENVHGDNNLAMFNTEILLNGIRWNMKCLHPQLGTPVLCDLIEETSKTDTVCPYHIEDIPAIKLYEQFVQMGVQCLELSPLGFNTLENYTTVEEYRRFAKSYCSHEPFLKHCLADLKSNSEKCQDHEHHNGVLILYEMAETALETGCSQEGHHIGEVYFNQYSTLENLPPVEREAFTQCARNKTHNFGALHASPPTTRAQLFAEVQGVKGCFVDHIHVQSSYKDAHLAFLNEILSKVNCIDPNDGSKVLCETIVNHE